MPAERQTHKHTPASRHIPVLPDDPRVGDLALLRLRPHPLIQDVLQNVEPQVANRILKLIYIYIYIYIYVRVHDHDLFIQGSLHRGPAGCHCHHPRPLKPKPRPPSRQPSKAKLLSQMPLICFSCMPRPTYTYVHCACKPRAGSGGAHPSWSAGDGCGLKCLLEALPSAL